MSNANVVMSQAAAASTPLAGAWDLTYAYLDDQNLYRVDTLGSTRSLSISTVEASPSGIYVSPDGTKAYLIGLIGDDVNEYTLSTPWDISSGTYVQVFSVATEETQPSDLTFKPDGTKMYVVGFISDSVHEYTLSTAWDVSTASLSSSFSVATEDLAPHGISLSSNGTKMYIVGQSTDDVVEYDLSTAWDISTASFLQTTSVSPANPQGVHISPDGATLLVLTGSDDVVEYGLSTAFDSSTRVTRSTDTLAGTKTYTGISVSGPNMYFTNTTDDVINQYAMGGTPNISINKGLFFKPDGSRAYAMDSSDRVRELYIGTGFNIYPQTGASPDSLAIKSDGTAMYVLSGDVVYQYTLGTAWDTSTMSYASKSYSVATDSSDAYGLFFKSDGTKMYTTSIVDDEVNEYALSTAWDVSTASYTQNFSVSVRETTPNGVFFKFDGTKMYTVGSGGDTVDEYDLSTAWDISTASYLQEFSVSAQEGIPFGLFFSSDGTKMFIIGAIGDDVNEYTLSTAWNVTTASLTGTYSVATQFTIPKGLAFSSDGTLMYVVGSRTGYEEAYVNEYTLSTAWSLASVSFNPVANFWDMRYVVEGAVFQTSEPATEDVWFKPDGTKMYVIGSSGDAVDEHDLSTAWDITTATETQSFSVAGQETVPTSVTFKPDGTKMYVCGATGDDVNEYSLSTAWDISTASFVQNFSVLAQDGAPQCVRFKPDGTKMYVAGSSDSIHEYALSTAWDVSTASFSVTYSLPDQGMFTILTVSGFFFKPDGSKLYTVLTGTGVSRKIYEHTVLDNQ